LRQTELFLRARLDGISGRRSLFETFRVDELPRHRQWVSELAGDIFRIGALPRLSRLLLDTEGHVRTAASQAIDALSARE